MKDLPSNHPIYMRGFGIGVQRSNRSSSNAQENDLSSENKNLPPPATPADPMQPAADAVERQALALATAAGRKVALESKDSEPAALATTPKNELVAALSFAAQKYAGKVDSKPWKSLSKSTIARRREEILGVIRDLEQFAAGGTGENYMYGSGCTRDVQFEGRAFRVSYARESEDDMGNEIDNETRIFEDRDNFVAGFVYRDRKIKSVTNYDLLRDVRDYVISLEKKW